MTAISRPNILFLLLDRRLELLLQSWMETTGDPLFRWGRLLLGVER